MNRKGGLLIPFSLVLTALALLLGALFGNAVGRKNAQEGSSSVLDVKQTTPVSHPTPTQHYEPAPDPQP